MDNLLCVLPIGKENAIHQADLGQKLGVSPAAAKRMVHMARRENIQILSGTEGYWLPKDDTEREKFVSLMRKQALSRLVSSKPIKRALNETKGQLNLSDVFGGSEEDSKCEQK